MGLSGVTSGSQISFKITERDGKSNDVSVLIVASNNRSGKSGVVSGIEGAGGSGFFTSKEASVALGVYNLA